MTYATLILAVHTPKPRFPAGLFCGCCQRCRTKRALPKLAGGLWLIEHGHGGVSKEYQ